MFVKRWTKNILLVIGSVLFALALTEIVLIYFKPVYIHTITSQHYASSLNPVLGYELKPGVGDHNSDGLRADREYPRKKPAGVFRIVVAGDSVAYGTGVETEQTYAHLLEKMLNRRVEAPVRFEVINIAVPGYRISQVVERIRTKGFAYDPDLIVYGYCLNDIWIGASPDEYRLMSAAYDGMQNKDRLVLTDDVTKLTVGNFLLRFQIARRIILFYRSLVYERLKQDAGSIRSIDSDGIMKRHVPAEIVPVYQRFREAYSTGQLEDIRGFEPLNRFYADRFRFLLWDKELKAFADLTRQRGVDSLLLIVPVIYDYPPGTYNWKALHAFIRQVGAAHGIEAIDLQKAFDREDAGKLNIGDHIHPNAAGHAIIAEALYSFLASTVIENSNGSGPAAR